MFHTGGDERRAAVQLGRIVAFGFQRARSDWHLVRGRPAILPPVHGKELIDSRGGMVQNAEEDIGDVLLGIAPLAMKVVTIVCRTATSLYYQRISMRPPRIGYELPSIVIAIALCVPACGPEGAGDRDADLDAEADVDAADAEVEREAGSEIVYPEPPAEPAAVQEAAPPILTPCPEGWRLVAPEDDRGIATCDPWPESGMRECTGAEAHFTGEDECRGVGTLCPTGDFTEWPEPTHGDQQIVYVRAGAALGGVGTLTVPFGTIAEAMASLSGPAVLVLSVGTFDEAVEPAPDVILWGACPEQTVVTCTTPNAEGATVTVADISAEVRNLTITGARRGLRVIGDLGEVHLEGVVIDGAEGAGIEVEGGSTLSATDVIIRDTRTSADGNRTAGLRVESGGEVDVERAVLWRNRDTGIVAMGNGSTVRLVGVAIEDTLPVESIASSGIGLHIGEGARAEIGQGAFEGNRSMAVSVAGEGTELTLEDAVIRGTMPRAVDGLGGYALFVRAGAQAELSRVLAADSYDIGLGGTDEGTVMLLNDVVVRDTQPSEADGQAGNGMSVMYGVHVEVVRAVFERNRTVGVSAWDSNTVLRLTDVSVRDTQPQESNEEAGFGVQVNASATAVLTRVELEGNRTLGIGLWSEGTEATLTDVVVIDTLPQESDRLGGYGLQASAGASFELDHGLFERNRGMAILIQSEATTAVLRDVTVRDTQVSEYDELGGQGLFVEKRAAVRLERGFFEKNWYPSIYVRDQGTTLSASDLNVRDTIPNPLTFWQGAGVLVDEGAHATIERILIERSQTIGAFSFSPGSQLEMIDLVIAETLQSGCDIDECIGGIGAGAYAGGYVSLTSFVVERSALCGIQLSYGQDDEGNPSREGGVMELRDGFIARNTIGINVQVEDYDTARLLDNVSFIDNVRNWDSTLLPVPQLGEMPEIF